MRALILLTCPLLLGTGCLTPLIASERAAKVERISRFDSGCSSMRMVQRMGNRRYKLYGCGQTFVYACHDRPRFYWDRDAETIDLLLTGGMDADAPCRLVSARRDPPPRRTPPPAPPHEMEEVDLDAVAADQPDDPGMAGLQQPAPRLPRLPEPAEIKRVMTGVEPELRRCGLPRGARLQVRLELAASGAVQRATVVGGAPDQRSRRCVEQQVLQARVSPFRAGPLTLAYLFDLR
jgi:hypothetical protein